MRRVGGLRRRPLRGAWAAVTAAVMVAVASTGVAVRPASAAPTSYQTKPPGPTTRPATATTGAPPPPPKAWILVDGDSGNVIDAGNDRAPMPPASLTKVITALAASNLAPDTPVTISARAAAAPADKLSLKPGQVWTADEMLRALLLSSANDAAVALAEQVGGTLEGFQPVFARTALGLGMADNPVLMDPAGLDGPDGVDGGNLVSARDLAIAGRALLGVPSLAAIVATPVYYFDGPDNVRHRLTNHNKLFLTTYAGGIGVKTGYTKRAGGCLMAAARVGGRTMLAVVLNSANPTQAVKLLLDKGFAVPVSAEAPTDALPAVNLSALRANAGARPAATGSPAPATAGPGPAAPSEAAGGSGAGPVSHPPPRPLWLLGALGALALLLCLALATGPSRTRGRSRVQRRRPRPAPGGWPDTDRWAA